MKNLSLNSFSDLSIHLIYFGNTINFKDHLNAFEFFFTTNKVKTLKSFYQRNIIIKIFSIIKKSLFSKNHIIFISGPSKYDLILVMIASLLKIKTIYYAHEPNPLKILNYKNFHKRILIFIYQQIIFRLCTQILPASLFCKSELKFFKNIYAGFVPLPFKKYNFNKNYPNQIYDYVFISRKLQLNKGFSEFLKFARIFSSKKFLLHTSEKGFKNLKSTLEIPKNVTIDDRHLPYKDLCESLLRCKTALVLPENTTQSSARSIFWNLGIPLITTNCGMEGFEKLNPLTLTISNKKLRNLKENKILQEKIINFSTKDFSTDQRNLYQNFTESKIKNFLQNIMELF